MRIQETKIMRIHADADSDADPQHCYFKHRHLFAEFEGEFDDSVPLDTFLRCR